MRRVGLQAGLIVAAALGALAPIPSSVVERWFSTGIYPRFQPFITRLSNAAPFAVFDLFIVVAITAVITLLVRGVSEARRAHRLTPVLRSMLNIASLLAAVYLAFLFLWGLNYRRTPMTERIEVKQGTPASEAVLSLGLQAASRLNELHGPAHSTGWSTEESRREQLRSAFADVQRFLSDAPLAEPGRLKRTLLGAYFRWTGVDGMIDPFALEVLGNPDLLPFERPFVAAHEWAHLAGYADESEANFVGWLTCVHAAIPEQYSGWLSLFWQVSGEVGARDRTRLVAALEAGPRRDVEAVADRLRRGQLPALRTASWAVYDQYLKANRVEEGVRSYSLVVTLILQARFEDGWIPRRARQGGS